MGTLQRIYRYERKAYKCKCVNGDCDRFDPKLCDKEYDDQPTRKSNTECVLADTLLMNQIHVHGELLN